MLKKTTPHQLKVLLKANSEDEHLEFKEAKTQYSFNKGKHSILGYCTAIANERGGKLVLGVSDKHPRKIIGTKAFSDYKKLERDIYKSFGKRVMIQELFDDKKRVLILNIPSRPIAEPLQFKGAYLARLGDELVSMKSEQLKEIYSESISDYSSQILPNSKNSDIDSEAIKVLRTHLLKSGRTGKNINELSDEQLLTDLNLITEDGITIACIVLLGKEKSLARLLPFSEIRYGYKQVFGELRNKDTKIYRKGYLLYEKEIWDKINSRNLTLTIPQGLRVIERKAYDKETVREAINNAIIHRNYAEGQSILIHHSPEIFIISSPGGLPDGITIENMIDKTKPRNSLIANVLLKCGFIETFGHGVNLIYKKQLELGKIPPDYSKTDKYNVELQIDGVIKYPRFTQYVFKVADDLNKELNDQELRLLYQLKDDPQKIKSKKLKALMSIGIVEKTSQDEYMLAKSYYDYFDEKGEYTRRKGLDKEISKKLLLTHIETFGRGYKTDFIQVLRGVSHKTIEGYTNELKDEGKIELIGNPKITTGKNKAYWVLKSSRVV